MLDDVIGYLRCPHCGGDLSRDGPVVRCAGGRHRFDVARHGYVSLFGRGGRPGTGDTAAMVHAREDFLSGGHYAPLARTVADACGQAAAGAGPGCVVDVGAGTGYYLRAVLDRLDGAVGVALDLSSPALRRAARAHPRIGAVACDAWAALPVRSGVAAVVLSVFAPRNGGEIGRLLKPDGVCVVVTPAPDHLAEISGPLGLLRVDERKAERLHEQLSPHLTECDRHCLVVPLTLHRPAVVELAAMGPTAWHTPREAMARRAAALPDPVTVTASFVVSVYRTHRGGVWSV